MQEKYKAINFLCDSETYKRFKIRCVQESTTLATVLRRLILSYLQQGDDNVREQRNRKSE